MDTPHLDLNILANHPVQSVDLDYRGIRIKVHKNGDQYDRGTAVVICRKRFRHWLTFLDFLTKKLNLTAPVHEFYRTDGLRIQHFEEIENGGSYVAVSQGPFVHKPYGSLPEDREKWNINPKFKSPEQSTLNSSESVDIYLKQRGYTSRTGLPFPFDGGVCANHSLMKRALSRAPSICQHHNELKMEENSSKNGELMKNENSSKEGLGSVNSRKSITHPNCDPTICNTKHQQSLPESESKASICGGEASTTNNQITEENVDIFRPTMADATVKKVGENNCRSEIATQNDRRLTVKEYDECLLAPVIQISDSTRKFPVTQDVKHIGSLEMMRTTNLNYCSLPMRSSGTAISVVNDDALISASNSPIVIVNISAGQKKSDNLYNNGNKGTTDTEITSSLANEVRDIEVPSENLAVKMALLPKTKTPVAIHINGAPLAATTDPSLSATSISADDQTAKTESSKRCNEKNAESCRIYLKECSGNLLTRKNSKRNENNLMDKFKESRSTISEQNLVRGNAEEKTSLEMKKQICDTSKNNTKLNKVSRNLKESTLLSSVQQSEFKQNSDDFGHEEDDSTDNNQIRCIGVASEDKGGSKNKRQMTCAVPNSREVQGSLMTDKNSHCRKHVTLVTPSIVEANLEMESGKAEILSDSERQLKYSRERTSSGTKCAAFPVTATTSTITNTTSSNSITDFAHSTADSRNVVITHAAIVGEKEIPTLQRKYQSEGETIFESDYTPRNDRVRRNSTHMKTPKIKTDLNRDYCRLPTQSNYDPDFKDYDFIH